VHVEMSETAFVDEIGDRPPKLPAASGDENSGHASPSRSPL